MQKPHRSWAEPEEQSSWRLLDRIIPWQDLKSLIGPYYSEGKRGAQPYPLELMIRIHFLPAGL
ncbi:MAG: hypothetical protein ACLSE8_05815 [Parasutterella sp.]